MVFLGQIFMNYFHQTYSTKLSKVPSRIILSRGLENMYLVITHGKSHANEILEDIDKQ